MYKFYVNLALFVLFYMPLSGQYNYSVSQIDSLKNLLNSNDQSIKQSALFNLGQAYSNIDALKSFMYFNESLTLARKIGDKDKTMGVLFTLGYYYTYAGEPVKSIELMQEGLQYAKSAKYDLSMPLAFLANNYEVQGDIKTAFQYANQSYIEYEKNNKSGNIIIDSRGYPAGPMRLGELYEKLGQLDSALYYGLKSYDRLLEKPSQETDYFYSPVGILLGNVYMKMQHADEAFTFYSLAYNKANQLNYKKGIIDSQIGLGKYYFNKNNMDSVIHYLIPAYEGGKQIHGYEPMKLSAELLRKAYEKKGMYKMALYFNDLFVAARDSVSGADKVREVASLTFNEEKRQAKIEQELEAGKVAYQNTIKMYSLLGIIGGVLLFALIIYRSYRQKHKANVLLKEQKEKVESTLSQLKSTQSQLIQSEKMASLGELTAGIAHEIQNPLNFVNNFSELSVDLVKDLKEEIEKSEQDKEYIGELFDDLSQNQEKINHHGQRASSIVKGMLEHSRKSSGTKEATDINALCDEYLRLAYHGLRAKDKDFNATMETHFDPALPKIEVIPQDISRVVLNIINNAFYAVAERSRNTANEKNPIGFENLSGLNAYQPKVTITTKRVDTYSVAAGTSGKNQAIQISISDNGPGIPDSIKDKIFQPFFTTKPTGQGTGLGLSLAYDIVTKGHGGMLKVESRENEGSEFVIILPL